MTIRPADFTSSILTVICCNDLKQTLRRLYDSHILKNILKSYCVLSVILEYMNHTLVEQIDKRNETFSLLQQTADFGKQLIILNTAIFVKDMRMQFSL